MKKRDDFSKTTKEILAKRVGTLCSNPGCGVPTYGPHTNPEQSVSKGVAAHIKAAAPGGKRYDPNMTSKERFSIENGIWLCASCSVLIDKDEKRYGIDTLKDWKLKAEERAQKALENPKVLNTGPDYSDTLLLVTRQFTTPVLDLYGSRRRMPIKISPIQAKRDIKDVKVPIVLGSYLKTKDTCLINLTCQNQGAVIDEFIKVDINFEKSAICSIKIDDPEQWQLIGGGENTDFASFKIRSLLPGEYHGAKIVAKSNIPFTVKLWSKNSGESPEVFIYDVTFDPPENVPFPLS